MENGDRTAKIGQGNYCGKTLFLVLKRFSQMGSKVILAAVHREDGEDTGRACGCCSSLRESEGPNQAAPEGLEWGMAQCLILWSAVLCWGICPSSPP